MVTSQAILKVSMYAISFNPYNNTDIILLFLFLKQVKEGWERGIQFLKISQQGYKTAGMQNPHAVSHKLIGNAIKRMGGSIVRPFI